MSLSDLANLGEFISGIAVIASLIYLAVQIRQNTKSVRSATLASNTDMWANLLLTMSDPKNVGAYMYGSSGRSDIRPKEFAQFMLQCRVLFICFENQYYQFRNGMLDEETYKGYERSTCSSILNLRGFRVYWQMHRDTFSPVFITLVDEMIARTPEIEPSDIMMRWQDAISDLEGSDPDAMH